MIKTSPPTWHAKFADGSILSQYKDGTELSFSHVLKHPSALEIFTIILNGKSYTVSLKDGMFTIDGVHVFILDTNKYPPNQLKNIRVIYYINERTDFVVNSITPVGPSKFNHLKIGFQALFKGKNVKRYLEVYSSGDFIVREK